MGEEKKAYMVQMAPQAKLKRNISKVGNKHNTVHLIYFHPLILCYLPWFLI